MLCRLYDCDPPAVQRCGTLARMEFLQVKALSEAGQLVLRYNQQMGVKHLDSWSGLFIHPFFRTSSINHSVNACTFKIV